MLRDKTMSRINKSNIEIAMGIPMLFYERVNRIASRDDNLTFATDFASLVRYDRFPSLVCFENRSLLWRCREFVNSKTSVLDFFSTIHF